jgi:hypothetical protein
MQRMVESWEGRLSVQTGRALSYASPLFLYSYRDGCVDAADPQCNFGW